VNDRIVNCLFARWRRGRGRTAWQPVGAVLVAVLAASSPAGADPDSKPADAPRRETGVLPLVGGDTDIGLGVGALGSVTAFRP